MICYNFDVSKEKKYLYFEEKQLTNSLSSYGVILRKFVKFGRVKNISRNLEYWRFFAFSRRCGLAVKAPV